MTIFIKKCPKCGHIRRPEEAIAPECCPACGLYFEKWANRDKATAISGKKNIVEDSTSSLWRRELCERLTNIPGRGNIMQFYVHALMMAAFFIWGIRLARMNYRYGEMSGSFMHNILLPIHEAGHILFLPFGEFMTILGGSLFQLLLPLIVAGTILWKNRDPFGAAIGVWWCGVSLMDLAPYIYDAKQPQLILLGGHTGDEGPHDWIYLLGVFHRIGQSQTYGAIAHTLGMVMMSSGIAAAAVVLWRMWKMRNNHLPIDRSMDISP